MALFLIVTIGILLIMAYSKAKPKNQHEAINQYLKNLYRGDPLPSKTELRKRNIYVLVDKVNNRNWPLLKKRHALTSALHEIHCFLKEVKDRGELRAMENNKISIQNHLELINKEIGKQGIDPGPHFCRLCGQKITDFSGDYLCRECDSMKVIDHGL